MEHRPEDGGSLNGRSRSVARTDVSVMMQIDYVRVSRAKESRMRDALVAVSVDPDYISEDAASTDAANGQGWMPTSRLRRGGTLVVWELDR